MFRDNRKKILRNRVIFAALGVSIMTFGIWLNYQSEEPDHPTEETAKNVSVEKRYSEQDKETSMEEEKDLESDGIEVEDTEEEGSSDRTDTEIISKAYLIKETDGVVKVYLCHDDGSKELYLITSIPFDLLSESDQQLLREGVSINTDEDLGKFLENFDS